MYLVDVQILSSAMKREKKDPTPKIAHSYFVLTHHPTYVYVHVRITPKYIVFMYVIMHVHDDLA